MNPNDSIDRKRLHAALENSWETLRDFRQERTELVRDYAGSRYKGNRRREIVVNDMLQTAEAYSMALAANMPRVLINPRNPANTAFAFRLKGAINHLLTEIRFDESMEAIARDAFFGPGIGKTYLADAPLVQTENDVWMDPGQPFFSRISLDHFIYDAHATDWRRIRFASDRYRVPYDRLKEDVYDQKVVKGLSPTSKRQIGDDPDLAESISTGLQLDDDEVEPMCDLADVWDAAAKKIYVWAVDRDYQFIDTKPLAVVDWDGHEDGPYSMLNLGPVPDNVMPTSPASNIKSLFDLRNSLWRKFAKQARREKTNMWYEGQSEDDARRYAASPDGESFRISHREGIGTIHWGGVDQGNLSFSMAVGDMLNRMAGNPGGQLGLDAQASTATQEQIIQGRIDSREGNLRFRVNKFAAGVARGLGILLYNDPVKTIPMTQEVGGYRVDASWTPEYREGNAFEYDYDVEPFSMAYKPPQVRAAQLQAEVQMWVPMMPQLAEMGIQIDLKEYLRQRSELLDMPRLLNIFKFDQPSQQMEQSGAANPNKPNGNYTRTNVSNGMSDAGHSKQMQQLAMGAANSQTQAAG